MKQVKNQLKKKELYTSIINLLKSTTNLTIISKKLNISKQNLNNYLINLKEKGFVVHKDKGWWELTEKSKNSTKYGELLPKDFIRGHAYVWNINFPKEIKDWDKRIEILKNKEINYNLVGALKDIPRIKVLGRKIWLCKNHLRIFDRKDNSYYGQNSIESRNKALNEVFLIVATLERKLGIFLKPLDIEFKKEHYALIKNDLAIDQNRKGIIIRISDEFGEWLLIDDSLEKGGELENVGKKSFNINPKMQNWWNDNKKFNFEVTPSFIMDTLTKISSIQIENQNQIVQFSKQIKSHLKLIKTWEKESVARRKVYQKEIKEIKDKSQKSIFDY